MHICIQSICLLILIVFHRHSLKQNIYDIQDSHFIHAMAMITLIFWNFHSRKGRTIILYLFHLCFLSPKTNCYFQISSFIGRTTPDVYITNGQDDLDLISDMMTFTLPFQQDRTSLATLLHNSNFMGLIIGFTGLFPLTAYGKFTDGQGFPIRKPCDFQLQ